MTTATKIVRTMVRGQVQGVGFRAWTRHQAQLHGLSGWVRNLRDGSVEALFAGSDDAVAVMLRTLRDGPRGSRVEAVEEHPATFEELAQAGTGGFALRETI
ncbi:MAG: acylphosphatase [Enterovirga sp.]|nr:acylphosphatase [Enterovirga sp.]